MKITEDYCSFELSKLLKEKGFDQNCATYYLDGQVWRHYHGEVIPKGKQICAAPTQAVAMKWLREVHHIHTEICLYKINENDVEPKKSRKTPYYTFGIWDSVIGDNVDKRLTNDFIGDSYEEAAEAAIKYCLENLI